MRIEYLVVNLTLNNNMKKHIIGIVVVTIIVFIAGWNFNQSKKESKLSDLVLANIDALASGETTYVDCYVNAPSGLTYLVRDCYDCKYKSVSFYGGDYMCWGERW